MIHDTQLKTVGNTFTNSYLNLKKKFLRNAANIALTLTVISVPLTANAYDKFGYRYDGDAVYDMHFRDNMGRDPYLQKNKEYNAGNSTMSNIAAGVFSIFITCLMCDYLFQPDGNHRDNLDSYSYRKGNDLSSYTFNLPDGNHRDNLDSYSYRKGNDLSSCTFNLPDDCTCDVEETLTPSNLVRPDLIDMQKKQDLILNGRIKRLQENARTISTNLSNLRLDGESLRDICTKVKRTRDFMALPREISEIRKKVGMIESNFCKICDKMKADISDSKVFVERVILEDLIVEEETFKNQGHLALCNIYQQLTSIENAEINYQLLTESIVKCLKYLGDFYNALGDLKGINDMLLESYKKFL